MGLIHESSSSHWALSRLTYLLISPIVHLFSLVVGLSPQEWFAFSLHETWSPISSGTEGLYFSHIFGFVEFLNFFSTSYPRKPRASLAVVAVALLWPGAHDFLSPELAVGFLKDGIIPVPWLQTQCVLGAFWSQRLQQISGVMRREVWWLLKSSFPLLVTVSQLQTILAGSLDRGHVASLSLQSLLSSQTTVWICPNDFYFHSSFSCAFPSLVLPFFFLSLLMRRKITVTFPAHINTLRWKWMRREHGKWVVPTV